MELVNKAIATEGLIPAFLWMAHRGLSDKAGWGELTVTLAHCPFLSWFSTGMGCVVGWTGCRGLPTVPSRKTPWETRGDLRVALCTCMRSSLSTGSVQTQDEGGRC